jgi:branched-chain amino acid aminotransferase
MIETLPIDITKVAKSNLENIDFEKVVFGKTFTDHMFIAEYSEGRWHDFKIVPYGNLSISPAMSSLHYGQALFEGLKAYKSPSGEVLIFRPIDNLNRLNLSARRMCMPELPEDIFMQGLSTLLDLDKDWVPNTEGSSLYIRPFMFATDEYVGIRPSDTYKFIIFCSPVKSYYTEPLRVKIETFYSRAFEGGTGNAKCAGNYAGALFPAKQSQDKGFHQLLWTDAREHKYFEESGTMNVFFQIGNKLITPELTNTILDGITRRSVIQLAKEWGIEVEQRKVTVAEVIEAIKNNTLIDAFGAGTAATIAPIAVVGHNDDIYTLPEISQRELSIKILKRLNEIRTGVSSDPYNWTVKI